MVPHSGLVTCVLAQCAAHVATTRCLSIESGRSPRSLHALPRAPMLAVDQVRSADRAPPALCHTIAQWAVSVVVCVCCGVGVGVRTRWSPLVDATTTISSSATLTCVKMPILTARAVDAARGGRSSMPEHWSWRSSMDCSIHGRTATWHGLIHTLFEAAAVNRRPNSKFGARQRTLLVHGITS